MEETNIKEVVEEIRNAGEAELKETIEKWFESTRTAGMKIGAQYISAGVYGVIKKHLNKKSKASLNDYRRMTDEIIKVIYVQLIKEETIQNDLEENNDRTTEEINRTDSDDNKE
jgi:O-acetyl-ADP-ribose deacetylase (regulator of RNase III)